MIIYVLKSTVLLGLLWGLYKLFLENEKMHRFNRGYLLMALVVSFTAPLITFDIQPNTEVAGINIDAIEQTVNTPARAVSRTIEPILSTPPSTGITRTAPEESAGFSISLKQIILGLYVLVTALLLIRFLMGLFQIRKNISGGEMVSFEKSQIVLVDQPIVPQSFLQYIFLNKEQYENGELGDDILEHEYTHVRQLHSFDVLLIESLKVFFWFNPFMYLIKHSMLVNHEFLADDYVIRKLGKPKEYQNSLLRFSTAGSATNLSSSLNFGLTKKRIMMIGKSISRPKVATRIAVILPILAFSTFLFCNKSNRQIVHDNGVKTAIEPVLLFQQADGSYSERMERHSYDGYRAYIRKGKPFTGIQRTLNLDDNLTVSEINFEDGWPTRGVLLHPITETNVNRVEFEYEPSAKIIEYNYDKDGTLVKSLHRIYNDDQPTKVVENIEYSGLGELVKTTRYSFENLQYRGRLELTADLDTLVHTYIDNNDVSIIKEFHHNGQLKFKMGTTRAGYEGLMTMYDENGTIIEQELYENGELVETIVGSGE